MADMDKPEHIQLLQDWMLSYKPAELFGKQGLLHQRDRDVIMS
jgi:xylulose-5-phosphate/fructose-6-phosphate phosphoketolase